MLLDMEIVFDEVNGVKIAHIMDRISIDYNDEIVIYKLYYVHKVAIVRGKKQIV